MAPQTLPSLPGDDVVDFLPVCCCALRFCATVPSETSVAMNRQTAHGELVLSAQLLRGNCGLERGAGVLKAMLFVGSVKRGRSRTGSIVQR
jgi:hypothetical protein